MRYPKFEQQLWPWQLRGKASTVVLASWWTPGLAAVITS